MAQRAPDAAAKIASAREQIALIRIHLSEHPALSRAEVKRLEGCLSELLVDIMVAEDQEPTPPVSTYAHPPLYGRRDIDPQRPLSPLPPWAFQQQGASCSAPPPSHPHSGAPTTLSDTLRLYGK